MRRGTLVHGVSRLAAVSALALLASPASALSLIWDVDPAFSEITVEVTLQHDAFGTRSDQAASRFGGTQASTVDGTVPTLTSTGGGLTLDPMVFSFALLGTSIDTTVTFAGIGGGLRGGPQVGHDIYYSEIGGLAARFDLADFELVFDQGSIDVDVPSLPDFSIPVAANPIVFALAGYEGQYYETPRVDGSGFPTDVYDLELWLSEAWTYGPLDLSSSFPVDTPIGPVDVTLRITGSLRMVASVPEPATGLLMTTGLLGLAGWRTRRT